MKSKFDEIQMEIRGIKSALRRLEPSWLERRTVQAGKHACCLREFTSNEHESAFIEKLIKNGLDTQAEHEKRIGNEIKTSVLYWLLDKLEQG